MENLKSMSASINGVERSCCCRNFRKSTGFCRKKFRETGLAGVKQTAIPADGKSTFMDCTIPQAWDIDAASLEIVSPDLPEKDKRLGRRGCPSEWRKHGGTRLSRPTIGI